MLHKCNKSHDHMLFCSWDMARKRVVTFHFGLFFALLIPNSLKNENSKKIKKTPGDTIIFLQVYQKLWSNAIPFLIYGMYGCNYYFSCWTVFALLPPNRIKNQNFQKMKKVPGDIILHYICMITEIWCATDGWIYRRMDG